MISGFRRIGPIPTWYVIERNMLLDNPKAQREAILAAARAHDALKHLLEQRGMWLSEEALSGRGAIQARDREVV